MVGERGDTGVDGMAVASTARESPTLAMYNLSSLRRPIHAVVPLRVSSIGEAWRATLVATIARWRALSGWVANSRSVSKKEGNCSKKNVRTAIFSILDIVHSVYVV